MADGFGVENSSGQQGTHILIPLVIENVQNGPLKTMLCDIIYNHSIIDIIEILPGDLTPTTDSWIHTLGSNHESITITTFDSDYALANGTSGTIAYLNVSVLGNSGEFTVVNLSDIDLANIYYEQGTAPAMNGIFTIEILEEMDVNQSIYDRGFRVMPGWDGAQEFKPTYDTLSRVDLYMTTWGDPWGPIIFQICEDTPNGNVVYSDTISKDDCPDFPTFDWVTIDITDIPVTPGERYVIVLRDGDDGDTHNCLMWGWCDSYGGIGPYPDGEFLFRKLGYPTWLPIHDWDYTFRTYGYS